MFGFKKKSNDAGLKELKAIRDLLKSQVAESVNIHVGTICGLIMNIGEKTAYDVTKSKDQLADTLSRYVRSEILVDRQERGGDVSLSELLSLGRDA